MENSFFSIFILVQKRSGVGERETTRHENPWKAAPAAAGNGRGALSGFAHKEGEPEPCEVE